MIAIPPTLTRKESLMTRKTGKTRKPAAPSRPARRADKHAHARAKDSDMVAITALFDDFAHNLACKLAGRTARAPGIARKGKA